MTEDTKKKVFSVIIIFIMLSVVVTGIKIVLRNRQVINLNRENKVNINEQFSIKKNETVILKDNISTKIKLIDIEDSRCLGRNIVCVWEGELSYYFLINEVTYTMSTVNYNELKVDDYTFTLIEEKCNENEAVIKVTKG